MADKTEIPQTIVYTFLFECTSSQDQNISPVKVSFPSQPRTISDIKKHLQQVHEIPINSQNILLNLAPLEDNLELSSLGLRNDDILRVSYFSKADCYKLDRSIVWLQTVVSLLTQHGIPQELPMKINIDFIFDDGIDILTDLSFQLFLPWSNAQTLSNKNYFIGNSGLDYLLEFYSLILGISWDNLLFDFKAKQCEILICLWNLAETFELRREILKRDGLNKCIQSLIQVPLDELQESNFDIFLAETIRSAIGTLANLCELPETHLPVVSNDKVVKQLVNVCSLGLFDIKTVQSVSILFLVLSYTSSTHPFLISNNTMESLVHAKYTNDLEGNRGIYLELNGPPLLLHYHRATYLAQLFCVSFQHFTTQQIELVANCISSFIPTTSPEEICRAEIDGEYVWETFLPYIKLFFLPHTLSSLSHIPNGSTVYSDSLCVNLMALQNMLSRADLRRMLIKENLIDFVTCIPWHVPQELIGRANDLVNMIRLSPDIELSPPPLSVICKALVAKSYCGLENVIELTVPELIRKLCVN